MEAVLNTTDSGLAASQGVNGQANHRLDLTFQPHPLARNPHFQTIVSSLYRNEGGAMCAAACEMILEVEGDVRLQGFYSPQPQDRAKGLVLLLHGWLGQANSSYNIAIGEYIYQHGYAVFRLNMRDHGDTHHLNPAPFRGDLLDEAFAATQQIAQLAGSQPFYIIGASLGGNFAARLAWRHSQTPLPNLAHTLAFNPALDPYQTTLRLDSGPPFYLAYFRRKWRKSFRQKQAAFPDKYDFSQAVAARTCMTMTKAFIPFTPYANPEAYLTSYTIIPAMLATLRTPLTFITAADDPIVPVADFYPFHNLTPYLQIYIQPYGGHAGFIDLFPFRRWIGQAALEILDGGGREA
jgi:predicted alpha/beta-fold hydrolase